MKRAIQNIATALLLLLVVAAALLFARDAQAHIGISVGPKLGMSNPLTPHIGPVYWKPGDKVTHAAAQGATNAPDELSSFLSEQKHHENKAKCDLLHARYIGRHGLTTPRPLKGYSGCA